MDIVILHGTGNNPQSCWHPWMKQEMEQRGHTVYVLKFPTPENQSKESWCAALREQAPMFGENTCIIGHSSGATLLLHILEVVRNPIHTAILTAPVLDDIGMADIDALNHTFTHHNFDWSKITANAKNAYVIAGEGDAFVPASQPAAIASHLNVKVETIPGGGHLGVSDNYTKFPRLLELLP